MSATGGVLPSAQLHNPRSPASSESANISPAVAHMEDASLHFSRYTVRFPMRAGCGGLSTWWQQEIGSGHSTWALTVHVRHPMCVRCKELVCPCTPVLGISMKANDHPPLITTTYTYEKAALLSWTNFPEPHPYCTAANMWSLHGSSSQM